MLLTTALGGPGSASAEDLMVVMSSNQSIADALAVEGQSRGLGIAVADAPVGDTPLVRAASAQRTALEAGARLAVWVDDTEGVRTVRAVPVRGEQVRTAPLPAAADPTTVAVVAGSLLDELVGPRALPPPPVQVRVDVRVEVTSPQADALASPTPSSDTETSVSAAPMPAPASHEAPATVAPLELDADDYAQTGVVFRGGGLFAGVAAGATVSLGYYLTERLRLSAFSQGVVVFVDEDAPFVTRWGGTLAYAITTGPNGRFDLGATAGVLWGPATGPTTETTRCPAPPASCVSPEQSDDLGWTAGLEVSWTWELESFGLGFSVQALAAQVNGSTVMPWGYAELFVEVPL